MRELLALGKQNVDLFATRLFSSRMIQPQVVKLRFIAQYLTLNSLFHSVSLFKTFRNCTERSELDDERSNKAVTLSMELVNPVTKCC